MTAEGPGCSRPCPSWVVGPLPHLPGGPEHSPAQQELLGLAVREGGVPGPITKFVILQISFLNRKQGAPPSATGSRGPSHTIAATPWPETGPHSLSGCGQPR